ncbi:hypothetical protein D3C75_1048140 [compost metagenome]
MSAECRVITGNRITELKEPLAKCDPHHRRQQAFADRPAQVRSTGRGGSSVAFVDELAIVDHHQGVGANALAGSLIPGWEGVGLQGLQGSAAGGERQGPVFAWPGFGADLAHAYK